MVTILHGKVQIQCSTALDAAEMLRLIDIQPERQRLVMALRERATVAAEGYDKPLLAAADDLEAGRL